jgi:4-amino-4-deoxy-L-arabinose transferase-like glycosyltransferase
MLTAFLGGALVVAACWAAGRLWRHYAHVPAVVAFGLGAASLSTVVFALTAGSLVSRPALSALAAAVLIAGFVSKPLAFAEKARERPDRVSSWIAATIFLAYGLLYLVHALAPEIQPDAITYHLGLPAEYLRRGGFPDRVGFYEILPQGLEMLFLWAYAFGGHSAAKLVHFAFLAATAPLLMLVARRLGLPDRAGLGAAVLYTCSPVAGVSGTSAYTDAALVFFCLSAFYLLLLGRGFPAGIAAGFCYAIKISGLIVPAAAVAAAAATRQWKRAGLIAAGAALVAAPWLLRSVVKAENPVAPLLNRWIPNPHFHPTLDESLARAWRTYDGINPRNAAVELTLGGRAQGIFGPAFLLLPVGLLALRRQYGRWLWAATAVLALPWFFNAGARFLMPSAAFASLALASVLPRAGLWPLLLLHAVLSWPAVIGLYEQFPIWRLREVPLRAALRVEPEDQYLERLDEYKIARMLQSGTQQGEKIFSLMSVSTAYIDREVVEYWHSAKADSLMDALRTAGPLRSARLYRWGATFQASSVRGARFRLTGDHSGEWCVHEVRLYSGADRVYPSPQWLVSASPNPWETALAFDGNLATRWRTWRSLRAGMELEAVFDRPQLLTAVEMVSHTPDFFRQAELQVLRTDWSAPIDLRVPEPLPIEDLRPAAARALKDAGFQYVLAAVQHEGTALLGNTLVNERAAWGLEVAAQAGHVYLLRILP